MSRSVRRAAVLFALLMTLGASAARAQYTDPGPTGGSSCRPVPSGTRTEWGWTPLISTWREWGSTRTAVLPAPRVTPTRPARDAGATRLAVLPRRAPR